jgi:hypothetical protein
MSDAQIFFFFACSFPTTKSNTHLLDLRTCLDEYVLISCRPVFGRGHRPNGSSLAGDDQTVTRNAGGRRRPFLLLRERRAKQMATGSGFSGCGYTAREQKGCVPAETDAETSFSALAAGRPAGLAAAIPSNLLPPLVRFFRRVLITPHALHISTSDIARCC